LAQHKAAVEKAAEAAAAIAKQASAAGTTAQPATTPAAAAIPEPTLPPVPPLPPKPNAPARLEDYGIVGLPSLVSEALRPLLPQPLITEIANEPVPVKMFVRARTALLDPALAVGGVNADVRDAALMALRLLEARVYVDLYVNRFKDLDAVLTGAIADLRAAQASSCTCRD
jgi:hypothetical protein